MPIEVCRAADRFVTEIDGRSTAHSFSFGEHYDPHNLGFGAIITHNDEVLDVGAGYPDHLHRGSFAEGQEEDEDDDGDRHEGSFAEGQEQDE